jgi:fermentation-respiration switch protein FrsA (DUF1100 family)
MKTLLINLLIAYAAFMFIAYFFSDAMIFLPPRAGYKDNSGIIKLHTRDGAEISAVYLPNPKAKYTILVSHGNAEDIGYMYPLLEEMRDHGFAVFAYDYHGYGTSQGRASERNAYLDIDAAYLYLTQVLQVSPWHIIAYGRSVGAAVALDLAVRESVAALIMESPFVTAFRVLTRIPLMPFDKFDNLAKISKLDCPLLIIHGLRDSIVPIWHGKKLYELAKDPKQYFWVAKAGHNDVLFAAGADYWHALNGFVQTELLAKIH